MNPQLRKLALDLGPLLIFFAAFKMSQGNCRTEKKRYSVIYLRFPRGFALVQGRL